jgi:hypothetical protein
VEIVALLTFLGSLHSTGMTLHHGNRLGNLLLIHPILQPAPRLSLFWIASSPARASVWPGEGEATLKGEERCGGFERGGERKRAFIIVNNSKNCSGIVSTRTYKTLVCGCIMF